MSSAHHQDSSGINPLDHAAIRTIVIGIMLAMFLGALDQTIVATAMPTIGRALNDVEQLPWVVTAYLLSSTAVTPLYGKLSDIHGRRTMMLVSIGIFVLGSIACALGGAENKTLFLLSSTDAYPDRLRGTKLSRVDTLGVEVAGTGPLDREVHHH